MPNPSFKDDLDRPLALRGPLLRVISLVPSLSQTMCDLGIGSRLVGITSFCDSPTEFLQGVRRIGGTKTPKLDRITSLKPDLVLANAEENRKEDVLELERRGIPVWVTFPRNIPQATHMLRRLGEVLNVAEEAAQVADRISARTTELRRRASEHPEITVFHPIWKNPYMHFNEDTWLHQALSWVGGRNPTANASLRYPVVTLQEMAVAGVEVALLPDEPYRFKEKEVAEVTAELRREGAPLRRSVSVSGKAGTWHGCRIDASLEDLFQALHGEA